MNIMMKDGTEYTVTFKWDMLPAEYSDLFAPIPDNPCELTDYCGAVFFGNFKLEFIRNEAYGGYRNLFQYGAEDIPGSAYSYLEDGTPYEDRDALADQITLPEGVPFDTFAAHIENQICGLLCRYPELIAAATVPTVPDKWYPCDHPYQIDEITREA